MLLYTYKEADSDALCFNVHFWIGSESSQDEYGVRQRQRDSGQSKTVRQRDRETEYGLRA